MICGVNGAGKTTFAREFLPRFGQCDRFVNPDLIAQGLSPFSPERVVIRAGKILLEEIRTLASKKETFAFETTLSGKAHRSILKEMKESGYLVHLFYLWVENPHLAVDRVRERVKLGGHHVPSNDVLRRYFRSIDNFFQSYRQVSNTWRLFDNSTHEPILVAEYIDGKTSTEQ